MNVGDLPYRFQLDHDLVGDEEIQAMHPHLDAAVEHGHAELTHERDLSMTHLDYESIAVDGFDESGTKLAVNGDRGADDPACQLFMLEGHGPRTNAAIDD